MYDTVYNDFKTVKLLNFLFVETVFVCLFLEHIKVVFFLFKMNISNITLQITFEQNIFILLK